MRKKARVRHMKGEDIKEEIYRGGNEGGVEPERISKRKEKRVGEKQSGKEIERKYKREEKKIKK